MEQTFIEVDQTLVKEEWMEDEPERDLAKDVCSENLRVSVDPTVKCGEIFVRGKGRCFTFICAICSNPFESLDSFGQHVEIHLENENALGAVSVQDPLAEPLLFPHLTLVQENEPPIELVDIKGEEDCEDESSCAYANDKVPTHSDPDHHFGNLIQKHGGGEKKVPCKFCGRMYNSVYLRDHLKRKHQDAHDEGLLSDELTCRYCKKTFPTKDERNAHANSDHPGTKKYTCPHCPKRFKNNHHLTTHIYSHTGERPFKCKDCGKSFAKKWYLQNHMRTAHVQIKTRSQSKQKPSEERSHQSEECEAKHEHSDVDGNLDSDENEEDEDNGCNSDQKDFNYPCPQCETTFKRRHSVKAHIKTKHGEKEEIFPCKYCDRTYKYIRSLRDHMKQKHPENAQDEGLFNDDELTCQYCKKTFPTRAERIAHFKTEHCGTERLQCPQCPKFFTSKYLLTNHISTHTDERPFKCNDCGKCFASLSYFNNVHIRTHLQIKNYPCAFCPKSFVRSSERKQHELSHTDEKPHQCEECGTRYKSSQKLREHLDRHRNIKKFKCDICDKLFFTKKTLKEHGAVHSTERPHSCKLCGKNYPRKRNLLLHLQTHSDNKKYCCNLCGVSYSQFSKFYYHKKSNACKKSLYRHTLSDPSPDRSPQNVNGSKIIRNCQENRQR